MPWRKGQSGNAKGRSATHGHGRRGAQTQEFRTWISMRRRCNDPDYRAYPNYGGRGITVCERWQSFQAFLDDMGPSPSPKHTLDRLNGDESYSPSNCRWATRIEQNNNRRNNLLLTVNGRTQTVAEWSREIGIGQATLKWRIRQKWPAERVISGVLKKYLSGVSV